MLRILDLRVRFTPDTGSAALLAGGADRLCSGALDAMSIAGSAYATVRSIF